MSDYWYALHVKPHKERPVHSLLEAKGFEVYYPSFRVKPVNPRARRERPYFPGYMFVRADLEQERANTLRWIEGVHGLVEFGGVPARVPETLLEGLRQRLLAFDTRNQQRAGFEPGEEVRIVGGPFEGYEAIFDAKVPGKDRVQVLLTFLRHQPKRLLLSSEDIARKKKRK